MAPQLGACVMFSHRLQFRKPADEKTFIPMYIHFAGPLLSALHHRMHVKALKQTNFVDGDV
jgi:hypothetical protein